MSVLFEVGGGGDGERTLKALPYVVDTFDSALEAVHSNSLFNKYGNENARDNTYKSVDRRKLSAIYQFARSMPLLFEGIQTLGK